MSNGQENIIIRKLGVSASIRVGKNTYRGINSTFRVAGCPANVQHSCK